MENFDRLVTDFSMEKIIFLLENRKNLLHQLLQRRLQTNALTGASFNKVASALKEYDPQKKYHLRVISNHGTIQYYLVPYGAPGKTIYIPKKQEQIAKYMAQIQYNTSLVSALQKNLKTLTKELHLCNTILSPAEKILMHNSDTDSPQKKARLNLITPALQSTEEFAADWQATPYKKNDAWPERLIFKTNRGDMVRSKSEATIANELFQAGIPYKYEPPLFLEKGRPVTLHPDFVVLNPQTRREIIWEHFGLMDDPEYSEGAVQKMSLYQQNGFYPGKNLVITMETKNTPLSSSQIRQIIRQYF